MKDPASLVRPEILALSAYHAPPAEGLLKLDAMENPYRLPAAIAARLGARLAQVEVNRYPLADAPALKRKLRAAWDVPQELELVLGNGSDEVLQIIALALARPGAVALSVEPAFAMYRIGAIAAGLRYEGVPLNSDFTLDEEAVISALGRLRPALTWLAYPNNPTGNLFPRDSVVRIVRAAPGLVVVDEAYHPFAGGASLLSEVARHPNLVVVRTLSKLGLAGLRLGAAIAPAAWAREFEKLRLPYNVNALSAAAAELLLDETATLAGQAREIVADRGRLEQALDQLARIRRFPSAANFILVRVPDAPAAFEGLKQRGILVRNLHGAHPLLAHCLRFTVGTPEENARLIAALTEMLA